MSKKVVQSVAESTSVVQSPLTGRYDHALDPKKRLTIPSGWRRAMGNPEFVFAMRDRKERCVNIIPKAQMDAFLSKIEEGGGLFDPSRAKLLQTIGSMTEQLDLDVQGRIRISDKLLQFANLTTTVAMLGSVQVIKLWDPAALPQEDADESAQLDQALTALGM